MPLDDVLERAAAGPGRVVAMTGAGISAESGIPTFRGPQGYWTVGSRHHAPEEMATQAMFRRHPEAVWGWYLYRRGVCRAARPNAAHRALVDLEGALEDRFVLITQNVDGLHLVAGNSPARTLQVHGNLHLMRCATECAPTLLPVPEAAEERPEGEPVTAGERASLTCAHCGGWMRPHVLWFDESYDEERYRFETALRSASEAALLLVVGTSGSTNLPLHVAAIAARNGTPLVNIDPEPNHFASLARRSAHGCHLQGRATLLLPDCVRHCIARLAPRPGEETA